MTLNNNDNNVQEPKIVDPPQEALVLPILPTSDIVLFPRIIMPLAVWEDSAQKLVDEVLLQDKVFGVLASREETPTGFGPDNLHRVGTAAIILKMRKPEDGSVRLLIQGLYRFRLEEWTGFQPYFSARVSAIPEEYEPDLGIDALVANLKGLFLKMLELSPYLPAELGAMVRELGDPRILADVAAGSLNISKSDKQALLETIDVKERLTRVLNFINRELEILELGKKIQSQVKTEMEKAQKDYYLREQIRALEKELGQGDDRTREVDEILMRLEDAELPPHAMKEAERELNRLKRTPPQSPDHQVIRNYLEWMIELPWSKSTEDNLDLAQARHILDEDHYDLEKVKKRILEYLAVRKLKPDMKGPILCFVGPPGTGKTSLGRSIARALGRKFARLSLGGIRDEAEIRGHRRTYVGALPGRIIQSMRRAGSNNPVFILDEVDKIGADFRGDPSSALLEVLDPEQNNSFSDHYLDVGFDLSKVMFITTANLLDPIPRPCGTGWKSWSSPATPKRRSWKSPSSTSSPGSSRPTASLRRTVLHHPRGGAAASSPPTPGRRVAQPGAGDRLPVPGRGPGNRRRHTHPSGHHPRGPGHVPRPAPLFPGSGPGAPRARRGHRPGLDPHRRRHPLHRSAAHARQGRPQAHRPTGRRHEGIRAAALSYIRARAPFLDIEEDFFETTDLHVHVPAGAIPKDGPSAGLALLAALVSRLSGRSVKKGLAMTGEITLRGDVLRVGGIKNKALAAHRAGIKDIILPAQNEVDLEEVPESVRQDLTFHPVETLDQALEVAFPR
jgi:ATP-dependent Lon protease